MNACEDLLRRLALSDERAVSVVLRSSDRGALDLKTHALVRLGALLSLGAETDSCSVAVACARAAGACEEEIVDVLVAVGPVVGFARMVTAASRLALAIGYDVDDL